MTDWQQDVETVRKQLRSVAIAYPGYPNQPSLNALDRLARRIADLEGGEEYSAAYQDEYRRLWHKAAGDRDRARVYLRRIADISTGWEGMLALEALDVPDDEEAPCSSS